MSYSENFQEEFSSKEKFYSSLTEKKNSDKENKHVLKVRYKCEMNNEILSKFVL